MGGGPPLAHRRLARRHPGALAGHAHAEGGECAGYGGYGVGGGVQTNRPTGADGGGGAAAAGCRGGGGGGGGAVVREEALLGLTGPGVV